MCMCGVTWLGSIPNVCGFLLVRDVIGASCVPHDTRWFKYDRDKLSLVYTQIVPVIFEPPCNTFK